MAQQKKPPPPLKKGTHALLNFRENFAPMLDMAYPSMPGIYKRKWCPAFSRLVAVPYSINEPARLFRARS